VNPKSDTVLQDEDIADAVRSFIALQARSWQRRQKNAVLPKVSRMVLDARDNGDEPDVPGIIRQVWLERDLTGLLES